MADGNKSVGSILWNEEDIQWTTNLSDDRKYVDLGDCYAGVEKIKCFQLINSCDTAVVVQFMTVQSNELCIQSPAQKPNIKQVAICEITKQRFDDDKVVSGFDQVDEDVNPVPDTDSVVAAPDMGKKRSRQGSLKLLDSHDQWGNFSPHIEKYLTKLTRTHGCAWGIGYAAVIHAIDVEEGCVDFGMVDPELLDPSEQEYARTFIGKRSRGRMSDRKVLENPPTQSRKTPENISSLQTETSAMAPSVPEPATVSTAAFGTSFSISATQSTYETILHRTQALHNSSSISDHAATPPPFVTTTIANGAADVPAETKTQFEIPPHSTIDVVLRYLPQPQPHDYYHSKEAVATATGAKEPVADTGSGITSALPLRPSDDDGGVLSERTIELRVVSERIATASLVVASKRNKLPGPSGPPTGPPRAAVAVTTTGAPKSAPSGGTATGLAHLHPHLQTVNKAAFQSITLTCRARVCTSNIEVAVREVDLGECSVGDYRSAAFLVQNNSDLPALVKPFVESDTLSVPEKEVLIAPRTARTVQFDYVAQLENTNYKREAFLFNAFNPSTRIPLVIRAKNVDKHQVLLHSLFYKIKTYNSKRHLQLYFDKCLFDQPNLRMFSIRNLHTAPLRLHITVRDAALDVMLYQLDANDSLQPLGAAPTAAAEWPTPWPTPPEATSPQRRRSIKAGLHKMDTISGLAIGPLDCQGDQFGDGQENGPGDGQDSSGGNGGGSRAGSMTGSEGLSGTAGGYSTGGPFAQGDFSADSAMVFSQARTEYAPGTAYPSSVTMATAAGFPFSFVDSWDDATVEAALGAKGESTAAAPAPSGSSSVRTASSSSLGPAAGNGAAGAAGAGAGAAAVSGDASLLAAAAVISRVVSEPSLESLDAYMGAAAAAGAGSKVAAGGTMAPVGTSGAGGSDSLAEGGPRLGHDHGLGPHSDAADQDAKKVRRVKLLQQLLRSNRAELARAKQEQLEQQHHQQQQQQQHQQQQEQEQEQHRNRHYSGGFEEQQVDYLDGQPQTQTQTQPQSPRGGPLSGGYVTLPVGTSLKFIVVFEPSSSRDNNSKDELLEAVLTRNVEIRLVSVGYKDVEQQLSASSQSPSQSPQPTSLLAAFVDSTGGGNGRSGEVRAGGDGGGQPEVVGGSSSSSSSSAGAGSPLLQPLVPLAPRCLLLRAKTVRSQLSVLQKNINFGRTVVGGTATRAVTIVNRSSVPCIYSIAKSGSISSGFLQVPADPPRGRHCDTLLPHPFSSQPSPAPPSTPAVRTGRSQGIIPDTVPAIH